MSPASVGLGASFPFGGGAYVSDREANWEETEGYVLCEYAGVWSSAVQKVEGLASASVEPIDTNTHFPFGATSVSNPGAAVVYDDNGLFVGFVPDALSATGYPIGGVQSYYSAAGVTVRINYASTTGSSATSALDNIGVVSNSITAGSVTLSGTNTILCTSVNWEETYMGSFSVFRITEEYNYNWRGWNPDVYWS